MKTILLGIAASMLVACADERGGGILAPDLHPPPVQEAPPVDFAGLDLTPPSCDPCMVPGPGTFCGLDVKITPFSTGGVFGGFQSQPGSGQSQLITITLSASIRWATVKILDPDFAGNKMVTYDAAGAQVSSVDFPYDSMPGALTGEFRDTGGMLIRKIELVPAPLDYVAYTGLTVIPEGCAPPVL